MGIFSRKTTADRVNRLLAAGRAQEALDLCRKACAAAGATPQDWLLYGCLSADRGDLGTARAALTKAIDLDAGLAAGHLGLGKVLASSGDYPGALDRLRKAAQLQPDNPEIWLALGITCGVSQQMSQAEEYCRRALELDPESANARFNLANALQGQGKLAEAEVEYEAALKLAPGMAAGWSMLAQARDGLGKFAEAKEAATQALKLSPRMGEAHFTLGSIAEAFGDREQARDCFRQAAELLPNLPDAPMRLGQVLFSLGDYAGAAASFQSAVRLNPGLAEAHFQMGECFNELALFEGAINCYRRVVELDRNHLRAHYCIAILCGKMGRNAEAAEHYAEVLRLNPRDEQARHLLAAHQGQTTTTAPAAYVSTLFDGFAETFDEKLVGELGYRTPEILHSLVVQAVTPAPGSLDVIDLGCGTGLCAPLFRDTARTLHGVDLSPRMIDKARERGLYDALEVNDIASSLRSSGAAWDLALSSDVFVYVGDLVEIFAACAAALKPEGLFAFSVESGDDAETYVLRSTGRYAHAGNYIRSLATQTGFREIGCQAAVLRRDNGLDINGYVFLLQRSADVV